MALNEAVDYRSTGVSHPELVLDLYEANNPSRRAIDREDVEKFIYRVFARAYQADLNHYLPRLMALHNNQQVIAALGMREASSGPLFLEQYLDLPVEQTIAQLCKAETTREHIMEIGNLASVHRGGLRNLIVALTSYLRGAGADWVVFTAVPAVRKAFEALDLPLHTLAVAEKTRLDENEQALWGNYYDTQPVVVAGRVEDGYRRLRELIDLEKAMNISCYLWQFAFHAGCRQRNLENNQ